MMDTRRRLLWAMGLLAAGTRLVGAATPEGAGPFKQGSVQANGLEFHFLEAGDGPLALCLHGFPDSPWSYRYLLPALAKAGFRAVAPYMRGYAPTSIPVDGRYDTRALASDPNALHQVLGADERAVLIAHDWGAVAAWGALAAEPQRWSRSVIGNVPPFGAITFTYAQLKRSFYFWLFQLGVAEAMVAADDLAFIDGLWKDWSPGYDPSKDLPYVKESLRQPGHLAAAMGYYKSFFEPTRFGTAEWAQEQASVFGQAVLQPVLYLHGKNDGCIGLDVVSLDKVRTMIGPGSQVETMDGVGHFFMVQKPDETNSRVVRFRKPA
jgi:pimeloyl-ACP methyl ester carboxylesterase